MRHRDTHPGAGAARSYRVLGAFFILATLAGPIASTRAQGMGGGGMPSTPQRPTSREEFQTRLAMEGGPDYGPAGPAPLVVDVVIRGNETVPESEIHTLLRTRKDRYFDPETVQADVRRLVTQAKLRDVRTYTQPVAGGVVVTFEVFEVPTIRYVKFLGNRGLSDRGLLKQAGLKVGEPLNRFGVEEGRRKVEDYYRSKGFSHAQVDVFEGDQADHRGVVYLISEGKIERFRETRFVGNTFVTEARLKTLIKSKPGIFWLIKGVGDRNQIDEDVDKLTAYYRSFGYFSARIGREIELDDSGKWLTLTFVIDEGPRYVVRSVSLAGNQKFTTDSLHEHLELTSGQYFDLQKMNRDVNALRDAYGGEGHIFADVSADPRFLEEPGQLDLVYNVVEGDVFRLGEIHVHIAGEYPHTRRNVILNRNSLVPGEIIDLRAVRDFERRLKASNLFEYNPATGDAPRVVIRPPDLKDIEGLASPPRATARGQSPDPRSVW
ncbi:MAG: hypothetical protein FJ297_13985 [Planctomycetes bacterium]|nr:hypothetical protein [Planctomycetota bacterium]